MGNTVLIHMHCIYYVNIKMCSTYFDFDFSFIKYILQYINRVHILPNVPRSLSCRVAFALNAQCTFKWWMSLLVTATEDPIFAVGTEPRAVLWRVSAKRQSDWEQCYWPAFSGEYFPLCLYVHGKLASVLVFFSSLYYPKLNFFLLSR